MPSFDLQSASGESSTVKPSSAAHPRLAALDALRGLVMVLMALDHVRDFIHRGAMTFSPTDLARTTPVLFFTRWVTHFCMPTFMLTAGMGAFLWWRHKNRSKAQLSRFLISRGLWFLFLEATVMQLSYDFDVSSKNMILLLVLWIFGLCWILLAGLVWLPVRILAALSVAVIALHNTLDRVAVPVWSFLHQPGVFTFAGRTVLVSYPVLPWAFVMAAGFCLGPILLWPAPRRRTLLLLLGSALSAGFIALRTLNVYGDPSPRSSGLLSFLNCTKYPASLEYLLMTLGPALIALALLERVHLGPRNPLVIFGRVPFLYFVAHMFVIHAALLVLCLLRYGSSAFHFICQPVPSFGGPATAFPADFGFRLRTVYLVWIGTVALLYPVCRWYARHKERHKDWWLSYL